MQCASLNLKERSRPIVRKPPKVDKPRRYCQKRMINPEHSEDPRWTDVLRRFHCNPNASFDKYIYGYDNDLNSNTEDDMVLTVQNLKFQGDIQERKLPRTSFKFKSLTGNRKHRMFIKQAVDEISNYEEDRSSDMTSYYFDDYVKYILNNDRSRPSSGKSSIFLQDLSNKYRENKSTQVEKKPNEEVKKSRKAEAKPKKVVSEQNNNNKKEINKECEDDIMADTKVTFQKTGKRKSLTISRAQSPETIQVIRVDVVCNYSSSSILSDDEDEKRSPSPKLIEKDIEKIKFKKPHFADKYLLTNTIKSVDENLSGGSRVTLLCKTFKLSDRSKEAEKKSNKLSKETPPKISARKHLKG